MSARAWTSGLIFGTYEELADEYYDSAKHPTCANFREASTDVIVRWLEREANDDTVIAEVGAGLSLVAAYLAGRQARLDNLVLVDSSPKMLSHSEAWDEHGARRVVATAERLPFEAQTVDLVVASLGDPYNTQAFWLEAHRVLKATGSVLFTTPSWEWATAYRRRNSDAAELDRAEFALADGRRVLVPSWILPQLSQVLLIESAGLRMDEIADVRLDAITATPLSPKLRGVPNETILCGYHVTKANMTPSGSWRTPA